MATRAIPDDECLLRVAITSPESPLFIAFIATPSKHWSSGIVLVVLLPRAAKMVGQREQLLTQISDEGRLVFRQRGMQHGSYRVVVDILVSANALNFATPHLAGAPTSRSFLCPPILKYPTRNRCLHCPSSFPRYPCPPDIQPRCIPTFVHSSTQHWSDIDDWLNPGWSSTFINQRWFNVDSTLISHRFCIVFGWGKVEIQHWDSTLK